MFSPEKTEINDLERMHEWDMRHGASYFLLEVLMLNRLSFFSFLEQKKWSEVWKHFKHYT